MAGAGQEGVLGKGARSPAPKLPGLPFLGVLLALNFENHTHTCLYLYQPKLLHPDPASAELEWPFVGMKPCGFQTFLFFGHRIHLQTNRFMSDQC